MILQEHAFRTTPSHFAAHRPGNDSTTQQLQAALDHTRLALQLLYWRLYDSQGALSLRVDAIKAHILRALGYDF